MGYIYAWLSREGQYRSVGSRGVNIDYQRNRWAKGKVDATNLGCGPLWWLFAAVRRDCGVAEFMVCIFEIEAVR